VHQRDLDLIAVHVLANEEWLMKRILHYAKLHDYAKYTPTLVEPWRLSIAGLNKALTGAIEEGRTDLELSPDEEMTRDVIASFVILEAELHRQRGINLTMFLGLMKYYRQSYLDLFEQRPIELDRPAQCTVYLHRFFDRLEIAFCVEWSTPSDEERLEELQRENRRMTDEKNLYLTALESYPEAIIVLNQSGLIIEVNGPAFEMLGRQTHTGVTHYPHPFVGRHAQGGRDPEESIVVKGAPLSRIFPWLNGPAKTALTTGEQLELTQLLEYVDGIHYIQTILTPMLDVSMKYQGIVMAMADISATVHAYHQLQREESERRKVENRLDSVLQAADQLGLVETAFDDNHTITGFSPGAERISGYSAAEIIGRPAFTVLHDPTGESVLRTIRNTILETGMPATAEARFLTKSGDTVPTLVTVQPLLDATDNEITGFLSVLIDISERKRLEQQLLQSEKMATIAGLAAGVAHEINTPLSAILQSTQLIEEGLTGKLEGTRQQAVGSGLDLDALHTFMEEQQLPFFFHGIKESAGKASRIVANLLQFSRPGERSMELYNINELLDNVLSLATSDYQLRKEHAITDLQVEKLYTEDLPGVPCLAQDLEQVFLNIIKNSVQAMAERDKTTRLLRITTDVRKNHVGVTISDNGTGIPDNIRTRIFDPFFTTKDVGQGSGLGLSVCHSIICDQHGGTIQVESEPARGTTFTILLPYSASSEGSKP
jgi:PAS domain S-box-containing protein